jgi:hypothetical protein
MNYSRAWLLLPVAILLAAPAKATVVVPKDFVALCREADLIFVGTVTDTRSRWVDEADGDIETLVTFSDLDPLLGVEQGTVTLRFSGGEMDGRREEIAGIPRFHVGERAVIFARRGRWLNPIVGFRQGCFRVVEGEAGPVVLDADGHPLVDVQQGAVRLGAPEAGTGAAMPLDVFLERVRREITSGSDGGS